MRFLGTLVTISLLIAGCSDDISPTTDDPTLPPPPPIEDGLGLIRGIVIDGAYQPIAGATVKIQSLKLEATTDEGGFFQFPNIEPGTYFLEASRPGFTSIQASAPVEANNEVPEIVRIQLVVAPGTLPVAITLSQAGYSGCSAQLANYVFSNLCSTGGIDPDQSVRYEVGLDEAPTAIQAEMMWESGQLLSDAMGYFFCVVPGNCNEGGRLGYAAGESPLICFVNTTAHCGGGGNPLNSIEWQPDTAVRMIVGPTCYQGCVLGAVGVGLVVSQSYQTYLTYFQNIEPPSDWTYVENGEFMPGS